MSGPARLPGFLASLAPLLDHWGYLAVASLLFAENFGLPLPGETVLIAASVYAGAGQLHLLVVWLVGFAAAVAGQEVGYLIGRLGGHALVLRYGKYVLVTPERFARAEAFYRRRGGWIVIFGRYVEGLRQLNGIIAGTTEMPWRVFLGYNALGAAIWVTTWTAVGYLAGDHIEAIYHSITRYSLAFAAVAGVLLIVVAWRHARSRVSRASQRRADPQSVPVKKN
jgi:membrane protein DedA with SNARE-associated domain